MNSYKEFLNKIELFLTTKNFNRKGNFFTCETDMFYNIINFQKNKYSEENNIFFTINIGVTSKIFLDTKKYKFQNNLLHNQWETRIEDLIESNNLSWINFNNENAKKDLFVELKKEFTNYVFPAFEKFNNIDYLITYLLEEVNGHPFLLCDVIEALFILSKNYAINRIEEILVVVNSKAIDQNDKAIVNEILKELS